jgi:hypothetical protein
MLGEITRTLREHAIAMERKPGVISAQTRLEVVNYESGPMIEGFVETEMSDGTSVCWCLDVKWTQDSFLIEATLDRNSDVGSETLRRLPERVVQNTGELPNALAETTRTLLALSPE